MLHLLASEVFFISHESDTGLVITNIVKRQVSGVLILVQQCLLVTVVIAGSTLVDEKILSYVAKHYGPVARERLVSWDNLLKLHKDKSEQEKLAEVNNFFNQVRFVSDEQHWQQKDYWATPVEFLSTNGGDCEDFTLAKYFTLRELGVPDKKLRLTYVKSLKLNQAHMILSYFETPGSEPLVLDNLVKEIRRASLRRDLVPVYSFNGNGLWLAKEREQGKLVGKSSRVSRWSDVIQRMQKINKKAGK